MGREKQGLWDELPSIVTVVLALPFVLLLGLPLALAAAALHFLHTMVVYILVWVLWLPKGKNVLVVYSDSPVWHDYMSVAVLPLVQERAVVLNWSRRKKWPRLSLATQAFRIFGGHREFNPIVVVFRPLNRAVVFRLWPAFKDWKRGRRESLERLRRRLLEAL